MYNADPNAAHQDSVGFWFQMNLPNPDLDQILNVYDLPYNPYILQQGNWLHEIHLMNQPCTERGNNCGADDLFGTEDDVSDWGTGVFYVSSTGLHWGLNFPIGEFYHPIERMSIADAYIHFATELYGLAQTKLYSENILESKLAQKIIIYNKKEMIFLR